MSFSYSLWPCRLQHARLPCPSLSSRVCSNSCPLIVSVMLSNHLLLCWPLLLLPSIFPSISVFSNELLPWVRWPEYWSFSFSFSPSNEYSGLISFRDWLVWSPCSSRDSQESFPTHSSKASILWLSAFFVVQLLHPYMTTGKNTALTICTIVGKVIIYPLSTLITKKLFVKE